VIALHPEYEYSYAPGQVIKTGNDMSNVLIKFYDFIEKVVPSDQVFKLDKDKFQTVIDEIIRLEKRWIGKTVVARNNISHVYELGRILNQNGNIGRQYVIEWANGKQSIQNANHIFGHDTRKPNVDTNDYVIAPVETAFMPGRVIARKNNQLKIKFDGKFNIIEPLDYVSFLKLIKKAKIIISDSGGVQEEACILRVPLVTIRNSTERPETILIKCNVLSVSEYSVLRKNVIKMLKQKVK
jgi:hypothetical protein